MALRFHRFARRLELLLPALCLGLWACSSVHVIEDSGADGPVAKPEAGMDAGATHDAPDATSRDDGPDVMTGDAGDTGPKYPAFDSSVPQLVFPPHCPTCTVMATPNVRPIHFPGETVATQLDDSVAQYLTSSVWQAETKEYGIGAGTLLTPVMSTDTPAAMLLDSDVQSWLSGQLDGTHPEFGAVDATTLASEIFVLYYPAGTRITISSGQTTTCALGSFGGYHADFTVGTKTIAYVVIPRCGTDSESALMLTSSYLLLATAGDPFPETRPGYDGFDISHAVWDLVGGNSELPGACNFNGVETHETAVLDGGATVARGWSNDAMAGYHDPCVPPLDSNPFFASVPVMTDTVAGTTSLTMGINVASGHSKVVDVQLWSDGPTGPWKVGAQVLPAASGGTAPAGALTFAFNKTTGNNGDVLRMTVTPHQSGPIPFVVTSTLGIKQTKWYGLVGQ